MMKHFFLLLFSLLTISSYSQQSKQFESRNHNVSEYELTKKQRELIGETTRQKVSELYKQGIIAKNYGSSSAVKFRIPLHENYRYPGFNKSYFVPFYVDHDNKEGTYNDWNCGNFSYDQHKGTDFSLWPFPWDQMSYNDVSVVAAADGILVNIIDGEFDKNCGDLADLQQQNPPWNMVKLLHEDGTYTTYGHLKKYTATRKPIGSYIRKGEFLGYIGSSGISTAPHLHFEVEKDGEIIDPFAGTCSSNTSLWEEQQPYENTQILGSMVHYDFPKVHESTFGSLPDYADQSEECNEIEDTRATRYFKSGEQMFFTSYYTRQTTKDTLRLEIFTDKGDRYAWSDDITTNQLVRNSYGYMWRYMSGDSKNSGLYYFRTTLGDIESKVYFHVKYRHLLGTKLLTSAPTGGYYLNNRPENRAFKTGDTIHFSAFYQDAKVGDKIYFKIYRPDGTLYKKWDGLIEGDWNRWSEEVVLDDGSFGDGKWIFKTYYDKDDWRDRELISFTVSPATKNSGATEEILLDSQKTGTLFTVSPNPVEESTRLSIAKSISQKTYIEIKNMFGQIVHHKSIEENSSGFDINLSHLESGLYFLAIKDQTNGKPIYKNKIMKK